LHFHRRSTIPRIHAALLGLALCATSATVHADDADDFLIARDNYVAGEFAQAALQLRRLVGVEPVAVRPGLVEPARKYYAAALFSMGQRAQAEQVLEAILRDNPDATLSPTLFSPPLQSLFDETRQRMLPILNAIREQRRQEQAARQARLMAQRNLLRELATRETVVIRHSPWMALAPLGIPQFYAGQYGAGAAFLATELSLVGIAIGTVGLCHALVRDPLLTEAGNAGRTCIEPRDVNPSWSVLATLQVVQVSAWSLFGAVVIGGAVHALVAIPAERREVRARRPPPGWDRIELAFPPMAGGPGLSLSGRF
jgi:hypothetical protein